MHSLRWTHEVSCGHERRQSRRMKERLHLFSAVSNRLDLPAWSRIVLRDKSQIQTHTFVSLVHMMTPKSTHWMLMLILISMPRSGPTMRQWRTSSVNVRNIFQETLHSKNQLCLLRNDSENMQLVVSLSGSDIYVSQGATQLPVAQGPLPLCKGHCVIAMSQRLRMGPALSVDTSPMLHFHIYIGPSMFSCLNPALILSNIAIFSQSLAKVAFIHGSLSKTVFIQPPARWLPNARHKL